MLANINDIVKLCTVLVFSGGLGCSSAPPLAAPPQETTPASVEAPQVLPVSGPGGWKLDASPIGGGYTRATICYSGDFEAAYLATGEQKGDTRAVLAPLSKFGDPSGGTCTGVVIHESAAHQTDIFIHVQGDQIIHFNMLDAVNAHTIET